MRRRTPPDLARLAAARGALRRRQLRAYQPPAQRRAPAVSGSQASPSGRARVPVGALGAPRTAAAGGSLRHTQHARGRSARRPPPSLAADHAAALWQLWCRVGRTTTITCQVVESHAIYHRLQRATGAGPGANAGTAQRAGDGGRTYPANQHHVWIHTLSCVRRLTMLVPIGTAFGYGTRTHTLSRTLPGREASRCAVRPQSAAQKPAPRTRLEGDSRALGGRVDRSRRSSRPLAEVESTRATGESTCREWRVGEFQGATRLHTLGRVGARGGRLAHPTRPSPFGEAPSAAVDSPPRVGPRRGRVDRSPLPCAPPLPLQALPISSCSSYLFFFCVSRVWRQGEGPGGGLIGEPGRHTRIVYL